MAPSAAKQISGDQRLHLLVADDDPLLRSIAETKFASFSASIRTVADGREAIAALEAAPPDLLLLDLDMPHVDGFKVLRSMRANPTTQQIPVIVVTGRDDSAAIQRAFAEGASSFVVKPINWDLLIHQINFVWRAAENDLALTESVRALRQNADELQRKSADLKQALVAADQANRAKSRFLASASHELRTPLNAIIGFSEVLLSLPEFRERDRSHDYMHDIHGSGLHLLDLINRILDIAKLDIGSLTLCRAPLNLTELINEILSQTVIPGERKVRVKFSAQPSLEIVDGDSMRMKQVITNVLDNAIKFSSVGTMVVITAFNDAADVVIEIADQGIGMDAHQIRRALECFTQIDDRLERRYDGLGIGLSIAQRLVHLHGGQLSIRSEPDSGTVVTIRLPAIQA